MDRAATISSPTSPFKRLRRMSITSTASTGQTPSAQTMFAVSTLPDSHNTLPVIRPSAAIISNAVTRRSCGADFIRYRFCLGHCEDDVSCGFDVP